MVNCIINCSIIKSFIQLQITQTRHYGLPGLRIVTASLNFMKGVVFDLRNTTPFFRNARPCYTTSTSHSKV